MEKHGGRSPYMSEIAPLEEEAYVALAIPMLDEIIKVKREYGDDGPVAIEYLRMSEVDDIAERVGMVIVRREAIKARSMQTMYGVTIFHYKEFGAHAMDQKDSTAYKITDGAQGVKCSTDIMYADGIYIGEQRMNRIEHDMLLDELFAAHRWQLATEDERAILKK